MGITQSSSKIEPLLTETNNNIVKQKEVTGTIIEVEPVEVSAADDVIKKSKRKNKNKDKS